MIYPELNQISELISNAQSIVIVQADNPDGDSLASALALELIISDLGKEPYLYCGVDMPTYLRYLQGWDRVNKELPKSFDLSIIVDTCVINLFESLERSQQLSILASKPCVVLDHHPVDPTIPFATVVCNKTAVATGEVIYEIAHDLKWTLSEMSQEFIATSILSDSLGLMSDGTTSRSIEIIAALVKNGIKLSKLDMLRKEMQKKSPELMQYKGQLMQRIEYFNDDAIAVITIPQTEIDLYSHDYNPTMLVMDEMRMTKNTAVAIGFKVYKDGRITAKIRCNYGYGIANDLAQHFGGGGHTYASGFKITDKRQFLDIKSECINVATSLLATLKSEHHDSTIQYSI
ncbi:MAG: bifunctional oligoribonuclease/PAP phosphatase NrnA [Candidatus Saccharimonadales bacterium]